MALMLRHCAWCQPLNRGWRRWVSALDVRFTSGICPHCQMLLYIRACYRALMQKGTGEK